MSILLEWDGFDVNGRSDGHLGLGHDTALGATRRSGLDPKGVDSLIARSSTASSALVEDADPFFRMERLTPGSGTATAGMRLLVVLDGEGELNCDSGSMSVSAGQILLLPYICGDSAVTGTIQAVVCRTPAPA